MTQQPKGDFREFFALTTSECPPTHAAIAPNREAPPAIEEGMGSEGGIEGGVIPVISMLSVPLDAI